MRESGHCFTLSNTLHTILFWRREWGGWRLCNFSVMNYFSHLFSVGNSLCKNHSKIKHRTWRGNYLIFPLNFPCPSFFQQILLSWIFCFGGGGGGEKLTTLPPPCSLKKKMFRPYRHCAYLCLIFIGMKRHPYCRYQCYCYRHCYWCYPGCYRCCSYKCYWIRVCGYWSE